MPTKTKAPVKAVKVPVQKAAAQKAPARKAPTKKAPAKKAPAKSKPAIQKPAAKAAKRAKPAGRITLPTAQSVRTKAAAIFQTAKAGVRSGIETVGSFIKEVTANTMHSKPTKPKRR